MARNLDNITGMQVPESPADDGTWGPIMDTNLELVDAHNHGPGSGVRVPSSGLNINADVPLGNNGLTGAKRITFNANAAPGSTPRQVYVDSDNNLAYLNGSGNKVRITNAGNLDVAQFGGFKGDYGAAGASAYYDDGLKSYKFLRADPLPRIYDTVEVGDLKLNEKGVASPANSIALQVPAGLANTYTLTMPGALPGVQSLLQMSNTGTILASNIVAALEVGSISISTAVYSPIDHSHFTVTSGAPTYNANTHVITLASGAAVQFVVPLGQSAKLTQIHVRYIAAATGQINVQIGSTLDGVITPGASVVGASTSWAWATLSLAPYTEPSEETGTVVQVLSSGAANIQVSKVTISVRTV